MSASVETMAYVRKVPWHGLGVSLLESPEPQEMLKVAGLDWNVSKRPLYIPTEPLAVGEEPKGIAYCPDHFALVRDSDNKYLGPCGPRYMPIQNHQAFEFFERFTKDGGMVMETAGPLDSGRQVWALAKINDQFAIGDDVQEAYLLLNHPHIWGKAFTIMFTPIRVVCMNTLMMAIASPNDRFRMPHIREFTSDLQDEAKATVRLGKKRMADHAKVVKFLASKKTTEESLARYMVEVLDPKCFNKALNDNTPFNTGLMSPSVYEATRQVFVSPGNDIKIRVGQVKDTWWGAFNGVTYFSDHVAGRDNDANLTNAWFGQKARMKRNALTKAVEYAKAA